MLTCSVKRAYICVTNTIHPYTLVVYTLQNAVPVRGDPHIFIVGDPGMGKSQVETSSFIHILLLVVDVTSCCQHCP